jgi:hypothetical protein
MFGPGIIFAQCIADDLEELQVFGFIKNIISGRQLLVKNIDTGQ